MSDPITISQLARIRQQETLDKYVMGKSGGPIEEWLWQAGASLISAAQNLAHNVTSASVRRATPLTMPASPCSDALGKPEPCAD